MLVTRWCYWQGNRLAIHRSKVRVLALGKLLTRGCVPLSPSSIIWYWPSGVISLAGKLTTGLAESNDSLPPGLWLTSPVGWLAFRNWDQLHAERSGSSMGQLFFKRWPKYEKLHKTTFRSWRRSSMYVSPEPPTCFIVPFCCSSVP